VRSSFAAVTVALAAIAVAPPARADSCGKPDLVDMVPSNGATGVPLNARLGAHYAAAAEYLGEDVVLVHPDGSEQLVDAVWDATEQLLQVTPTAPLDPSSVYEIRWPTLRGLNAAAPGLGDKARFTTGVSDDTVAPTFAGVTGLAWDFGRTHDECTDDLVDRFVFDLHLGPAGDDGGTSGLTLMLFQTAGPQVTSTPTPIPARAWPQSETKDGMHVQVRLAKEAAVGAVCFAGIVRDTTGALSNSGDVETCVQTTDPPFFRGCSVGGGHGRSGAPFVALAIITLAVVLRRRSRRP
jgi:MYXO-CTERM domain-containing protein